MPLYGRLTCLNTLQELQSKERSLQQRILEQEKKEKQLNREKEEVQRKAERLEMLIKQLSQQQSLDDAGEEDGTDSQQPQAPPTTTTTTTTNEQEVSVPRPPRLKPFSIRGLIKKLWNDRSGGTKGRKVEGPLPNRVNTGKSKVTRRLMSSPDPSLRQRLPTVERREKRSMTTSLTTPDAPSFSTLPAEKRASLPNVNQHQHDGSIAMIRRHRRLGSDDLKGKMFGTLFTRET